MVTNPGGDESREPRLHLMHGDRPLYMLFVISIVEQAKNYRDRRDLYEDDGVEGMFTPNNHSFGALCQSLKAQIIRRSVGNYREGQSGNRISLQVMNHFVEVYHHRLVS